MDWPHSGGMKDSTSEKTARSEYWREQIPQHECSGLSVLQFCKERRIQEQAFYVWRKRLGEQQPMRFALVKTAAAEREQNGSGLGSGTGQG